MYNKMSIELFSKENDLHADFEFRTHLIYINFPMQLIYNTLISSSAPNFLSV